MTASAPVTYSPPAGTYGTPQTVTLSTETAGASIYYTVDGSEPSVTEATSVNACTVPVVTSRSCHIDIGGTILSGPYGGKLVSSVDGGVTWTQITTSPTLGWRSLSRAGSTLYATSDSGVHASVDGGLNWTNKTTPSTWTGGFSTIVPDGSDLIVFFSASNGYRRRAVSSDGGATWEAPVNVTPSGAIGLCVCASPGGDYFTGNSEAIYKSADKGLNWSAIYTKTGAQFRNGGSFLPDGSILWIEEDGYMHRSTDGGATFSEATEYGSRDWFGPSDRTSDSVVIGTYSATHFLASSAVIVGTLYATPLTIPAPTTVKAIAVKSGLDDSAVTSAEYTILPPVAPRIYPASGTLQGVQFVTIKGQGTIRYTLDGSEPSATSPIYTGPIRLSSPTTVKARAYVAPLESTTATATLDIQGAVLQAIPSYRDRVMPYLLEQYKGDNA